MYEKPYENFIVIDVMILLWEHVLFKNNRRKNVDVIVEGTEEEEEKK